jgi:Flp pilus assembly protein TadD
LTRVANACRSGDDQAYRDCFDMNLLVHRISRHPAVLKDRDFSSWSLKGELETGMTVLSGVGEYSIVRVERGEQEHLALVYAVDWSPHYTVGYRWWLVRSGRNWRVFDWERLDYEQSLAHTWAVRERIDEDANWYNYNTLRDALDEAESDPGGGNGRANGDGGTDLASLIDVPQPEIIHDDALFDLAWALIRQSRYAEAIRACESLRRPQDHPGYLVIRAQAQAGLGRHALALAEVRRYQELAGRDPLALAQEADSLVELDRHEEAAKCWRDMLHLAPNHSDALGNFCRLASPAQRPELTTILRAMRQPIQAAVDQAQAAISRDDLETFELLANFVKGESPESPAAIALDAQRLEYDGQHEQAAARFRQAADAEFRPDRKQEYLQQFLQAMTAAGKLAEGYASAPDPQAAFDYLTAGAEDEESSLTDAQLIVLLAEHEKRVATDARAAYLAGLLLLREEQFAAADAKFQSAMAKADKDTQSYYQGGRIETLYRLGRWKEAYTTFGSTTEVFRDLAGHCEGDGDWQRLRELIELHKTDHPTDRWIDFYEAKNHQQRGETALALAAIQRAEQGDDQLKAYCRWVKVPILMDSGQINQLLGSNQTRRQDFLDLANRLIQDENWPLLDDLHNTHAQNLGRDPVVLDVWTKGLWLQGKFDKVAAALDGDLKFDASAAPWMLTGLHERKVRCLLRLDRKPEARKAAEAASAQLGLTTPLLMVALAEGDIAAAREHLVDTSRLKGLLQEPLDDDLELAPLLTHPDLATVRERIAFPLPSGEGNLTHRVLLLLRDPRELDVPKLADLAAKAGAAGATVGEIPHADGDDRRSFRVDHDKATVLVTIGSRPYWKRGRSRQPPRDPLLARALDQHRGFVVLECERGELEVGPSLDPQLLSQLAAQLCDDKVLAIHHWQSVGSRDGRLLAFQPGNIEDLRAGKLFDRTQTAGESFDLFDMLRYPETADVEAAQAANDAPDRAANRLAQQLHAGKQPSIEVRVELWRGHARESVWLDAVAARKDAHGDWQLHGRLQADSVLRPHFRRGMRLAIEPYQVRELREKAAAASSAPE